MERRNAAFRSAVAVAPMVALARLRMAMGRTGEGGTIAVLPVGDDAWHHFGAGYGKLRIQLF